MNSSDFDYRITSPYCIYPIDYLFFSESANFLPKNLDRLGSGIYNAFGCRGNPGEKLKKSCSHKQGTFKKSDRYFLVNSQPSKLLESVISFSRNASPKRRINQHFSWKEGESAWCAFAPTYTHLPQLDRFRETLKVIDRKLCK